MATIAPAGADRLRVERLASTPELRERWRGLALASGNVYLAPEWIETWMRHLGRNGELFLYGAFRDDVLVAIVPIHLERRRGVRLLRFAGHELADQPGVVCAPGDRPLGREALARALEDVPLGWDVFLSDRQPRDEAPAPVSGCSQLRERCPDNWVEFDDRGWEGYLETRSKKLRYRLRHDGRRLERLGARYDVAELDDPEPLIEELLDLHDARWPDGSRFTAGGRRAFQLEVLTRAAERGWLRLRRILLDGETIASHAAFRFGSTEAGYLIGRKMGMRGVALGYLGFAFELREAIAEGASAYRYGYGTNEHKAHLSNRFAALETIAYPRTLRGRVALAAEARLRGSTAPQPSPSGDDT
jgi:CelD/BcsL family acetyltransferase involved in cellulose biosynthesis